MIMDIKVIGWGSHLLASAQGQVAGSCEGFDKRQGCMIDVKFPD
jgi:hypothetical protein